MVAIVKPTYKVSAVRSGRWWAIEVPELHGVFSQARRLDQVESMAREAIGLMLQVQEDSFDVVVEPNLTSLGGVGDAVEAALRQRERANAAQDAASTAMRHAVSEIRSSGYTSRDAGMLLRVSNQRISQIERQAADHIKKVGHSSAVPQAPCPGAEPHITSDKRGYVRSNQTGRAYRSEVARIEMRPRTPGRSIRWPRASRFEI
jgi:predicted RNase H-like HicB family nuclease